MPKVEMKNTWTHDNEVQLSTLTQGYIALGPAITQGLNAGNRIGSDINAKGLHLRGVLYNNSASESYVRGMVVGFPGTFDPSTALFLNAGAGSTVGPSGINGLDAMYYPLNTDEMHVYWNQVFKLGGSASGTAGSNTRMFNKFVKFGGRRIAYKGNVTGIGNQNWQYALIWIAGDANDDTTTGTAVELSQLARFFFTDA